MKSQANEICNFIRNIYRKESIVPLHAPQFDQKEKEYLNNCIDSTFVSSVGKYVDDFERRLQEFSSAASVVAVVNGTSAIHVALRLVGVQHGDEVITQAVTFIATCNAITYLGARPVFVDVDEDTMGMSPEKLELFLAENADIDKDGFCINKITGNRIVACLPMHTFGHPVKIDEISRICLKWNLSVIEDCAESLGSFYKGKHTGLYGKAGILSFNGNKIVTTGGGGAILTNDADFGKHAKHLTTTAKIPHKWEFVHDEIGYNYRMPNINAALGCAQLEKLDKFISVKRKIAEEYRDFFSSIGIEFVWEPSDSVSNFWLNAVKLKTMSERNSFLEEMNSSGIGCRPIWRLMNRLDIYKNCIHGSLDVSEMLEERIVNIPSGVPAV
jgi:aminotransferase in exopolysaccharide biosynthesis